MNKITFTLLFGLLVFFQSSFAQQVKFHRISAQINHDQLHQLFDNGLDIDHFDFKGNSLIAEVSDNDIDIMKSLNIKFDYLIKDLENNYAKINKEIDKSAAAHSKTRGITVPTPAHFALGSYGGYFTLQEMEDQLNLMRTLYPNLISIKSSIGNSIQNRSIWMVKISDNPDVDENEPEVFMNAVHHAREPISMSQVLFFMWHVLENYNTDKEIRNLLNSTELYIVPCVNPDGYYYNQTMNPNGGGMWRKNRRLNSGGSYGVDINRNYSYGWGGSGSSSTQSNDTYRGTAAFSEPETQAIRDFCISRNFVASMDFHSYGNYCIYPFGNVTTNTNPEIPLYSQISQFLTSDNNFVYGNAMQTVGYLASGAGDDWKYGEQTTKNKIYSFTPEVGSSAQGFYPASSNIIPLCNSMIFMNKGLMKLSTNYAEITNTTSNILSSLSPNFSYSIKNYSINPSNYTVSVNPISSYITSVGSANTYSTLNTLQNTNGQIAISLDPATPLGTSIQFEVLTSSIYDTRVDTFSFIYDCVAPNNLTTSAITTSSATLSWSSVVGASGYMISYKDANASTWNPEVSVSTNSYALTGLNPLTAYVWRVRENSCSTYSSSASFSTLSNAVSYCNSGSTSTYYSWMDKFVLTNVSRTSSSDGGYYDGSALVADVVKGTPSTLTFSAGYRKTKYRVYWRIWIDYNSDGDFNDAGEQVYSINSTSSSNLSFSLNVPSSVTAGQKRIRVAMKQGSYPTSSCEVFTYGETEDYTINILEPVLAFKQTFIPDMIEPFELNVSPNPFIDDIHIQLLPTEYNLKNEHYIEVYDINGRKLYKATLEAEILSQAIPTENFPKGMYILSITNSDNQRKTFKLIK
ncbi:MAG: M14 family zinc carboxypeptidase [Chitinophagaceae bacterium]